MGLTTWEKGLAQGEAKGEVKGLRRAIRVFLEQQFGPLTADVARRLDAWPPERLDELLRAVPKASSLQALGLEDDAPSA